MQVGQNPSEVINQITDTVFPMYKAFIEPDLTHSTIKIQNDFNPFQVRLCARACSGSFLFACVYAIGLKRARLIACLRCLAPTRAQGFKDPLYILKSDVRDACAQHCTAVVDTLRMWCRPLRKLKKLRVTAL